RLPSVIAMLATLTTLGIVVNRTIGHRRAIWTVFILATSGLTIAAAKMCLTDSLLLLFVTTTQISLAVLYLRYHAVLPPLPAGIRWADDVLRYGSGPLP